MQEWVTVPTLRACDESAIAARSVWESYPVHLTAPSEHLPVVLRSCSLPSPVTSWVFPILLTRVSPGSGTQPSSGNECDNPRPHMHLAWQGCTELRRSLKGDQLSQMSQLPWQFPSTKGELSVPMTHWNRGLFYGG